MFYIKVVVYILVFVFIFGFVVYFKDEKYKKENNYKSQVNIPSPITPYNDLEKAKQSMDFDVLISKEDGKFKLESIFKIDDEVLQLNYNYSDIEISFRQAKSSLDISGDYNIYNYEVEDKIGEYNVIFSGYDNKINLAKWFKDEIAYVVSVNKALEGVDIGIVREFILTLN